MPPYMVRYQPHNGSWLAIVYVATGDNALRPTAVLTGSWRLVRRRTLALIPALLERARPDDVVAGADAPSADAGPNYVA